MVDSRPNVWQMQSRHDMHGLIQALHYPDPEVRGRAAVALRTLSAVPAVPALKAALQNESDAQALRYLKEALHVLDQRTDVGLMAKTADLNGLIVALKSSRTETVISSAKALGKLGNRLAVEPLIILFQNTTSPPAVRLAAAEALLELKSAPAVVTLLGALRRDSWQVRRNAAAVLGQIQAIWAVEPLAAALRDPHPVVRRSAAAALKRIGTTEAISAIREAVREAQTAAADKDDQAEPTEQPAKAARVVQMDDVQPAEAKSSPGGPGETTPRITPPHRNAGSSTEKPARPDHLPEVERGEASGSHETHPSESTRPVVRVHKPPRPPVDAPPESAAVDTSEDSDLKAQTRGPITRMIDFLRRRGGES